MRDPLNVTARELIRDAEQRANLAEGRIRLLEQQLQQEKEQNAYLMKELTAPRPITRSDRHETATQIVAFISRKLRDAEDENMDAVWEACANWLTHRLDVIAKDAAPSGLRRQLDHGEG